MSANSAPSGPVALSGTASYLGRLPLSMLPALGGQVATPSVSEPAAVNRRLDVAQRAASIGEPVPIVFCQRIADRGGVLLSPGATEARFENSLTNQVTASWHLLLCEGQIDSIPVMDVFQGNCRVGNHTQTYDRRAGDWLPGNFIVQRVGYTIPECPRICGSVGTYPAASTLSFAVETPNGSTAWDRQVHLFIRGGMYVTRLIDDIIGPSSNFADLALWLLRNIGRVREELIDADGLLDAAVFLYANDFGCDCIISESESYEDLISKWAPYFLLRPSSRFGRRGLQPLLPLNAGGTIDTSPIVPVTTFTEDLIIPESFQIEYKSLSDRRPFIAQMLWRQQSEDDLGIVRTVEILYSSTSRADSASETHDMSEFCTSGQHAAMAGAHIVSSRVNSTHSIRFEARPQGHNRSVARGSIICVRLDRRTSGAGVSQHNYLYEVVSVGTTLTGQVLYECIHFPVDTEGRSIVALDVANVLYSCPPVDTTKTGPSCDADGGRATNTSIPLEVYIDGSDPVVEPICETLLGEIRRQSPPAQYDDAIDDTLDNCQA